MMEPLFTLEIVKKLTQDKQLWREGFATIQEQELMHEFHILCKNIDKTING